MITQRYISHLITNAYLFVLHCVDCLKECASVSDECIGMTLAFSCSFRVTTTLVDIASTSAELIMNGRGASNIVISDRVPESTRARHHR